MTPGGATAGELRAGDVPQTQMRICRIATS